MEGLWWKRGKKGWRKWGCFLEWVCIGEWIGNAKCSTTWELNRAQTHFAHNGMMKTVKRLKALVVLFLNVSGSELITRHSQARSWGDSNYTFKDDITYNSAYSTPFSSRRHLGSSPISDWKASCSHDRFPIPSLFVHCNSYSCLGEQPSSQPITAGWTPILLCPTLTPRTIPVKQPAPPHYSPLYSPNTPLFIPIEQPIQQGWIERM